MTVFINTLEFSDSFEQAGFAHNQAKALASAFAKASEAGREDLVTKQDLAVLKAELLQAISENGKEVTGRLWSTVTIIAGVSTAISATIGAGIALLFRMGGL